MYKRQIVGRSGYFSLNLSNNSVMRERVHVNRTMKDLVADLRIMKSVLLSQYMPFLFALRGWKRGEINGIEFELNSILVEKWKGKTYRLVIQRQMCIRDSPSVPPALSVWPRQ